MSGERDLASTDALRRLTLDYSSLFYDDDIALVCNPPGTEADIAVAGSLHLVPNSCWYAYGLLAEIRRGGDPSTTVRVERILRQVLSLQLRSEGASWHGTFRRFYEWPAVPPDDALQWWDYDPNWRQFVSCSFALLIDQFEDLVPDDLVRDLQASIILAVDSEPPGRIPSTYTNPRLMQVAASAWVAVRRGEPDRMVAAEAELSRVFADYQGFGQHFAEFNSPTYDGINLFALSILCNLPGSQPLLKMANELRDSLWAQVESLFVPSLGNISGPFSRAYGADMNKYVGLIGLWIWARTGIQSGPRFDLDPSLAAHGHDLMMGPLVADLVDLWGAAPGVPGNRLAVQEFAVGERSFRIFQDENWSLGVETSQAEPDWVGAHQRMPLVLHGRRSDGSVGTLWARSGTWQILRADDDTVTLIGRGCAAIECCTDSADFDGAEVTIGQIRVKFLLPSAKVPTWSLQSDTYVCTPADEQFELVFYLARSEPAQSRLRRP